MIKKSWVYGLVLGGLLLTAGCGAASGGAVNSTPNTASTGNVSSTGSQANTQTANTVPTGNADQGKLLFQTNCSSCHSVGDNKIVGPGLKGVTSKSKLPNG